MTHREHQLKIERINDALSRSNGDRFVAAELLEITPRKLTEQINNSSKLKAKWAIQYCKPSPDVVDTINRDIEAMAPSTLPKFEDLTSRDIALGKAMEREDGKVALGLPSMGLSEQEYQLARELQKAGDGFYRESLQIIGGGATRTSIFLQIDLDTIRKRLVEVRTKLSIQGINGDYPESRREWIKEEETLMKAEIDMCGETRKMMEMGFKSALIRATIEKNGAERMKRPKPGYVVEVKG